MSPMFGGKDDTRQEALRAMLAQRSGSAADARTVAEAAVAVWHETAAELAPVIGVRGVDVLFNRSLYLTSATFPWLALAGEQGDGAARLADFKARLEAHEAATATEAAGLLLATFAESLSTLIGDTLTERLLTPIWAPRAPAPKPENEAS